VGVLVGNPVRAKATLAWEPTVSFEGLVTMMVDAKLVKLSPHPGKG